MSDGLFAGLFLFFPGEYPLCLHFLPDIWYKVKDWSFNRVERIKQTL